MNYRSMHLDELYGQPIKVIVSDPSKKDPHRTILFFGILVSYDAHYLTIEYLKSGIPKESIGHRNVIRLRAMTKAELDNNETTSNDGETNDRNDL